MAGKIITKRQQQHIAGALTGMIATLDAAGMHWTKEVTDDLKLAYQMLGMPCPFEIKAVQAEPAKPGLLSKVKGALGVGT